MFLVKVKICLCFKHVDLCSVQQDGQLDFKNAYPNVLSPGFFSLSVEDYWTYAPWATGIFTLKGPVATAEVLLLKARLWLDVCLDEVFSFKWINFWYPYWISVVLGPCVWFCWPWLWKAALLFELWISGQDNLPLLSNRISKDVPRILKLGGYNLFP